MKKIKISQVAKINSDSIKGNIEDTILYLDTSSVTKGIFSEPQILNSKNDKIPSRAKRKVRENTILISTVRPNLCHFGIIKKNKKNLIVSTGFVTIDASPELIDANYLYYLLTSNDTIKYLDKIASTSVSAYPSFTPNDIKNYEISIIENINFQKKIGNLLYKIEEKIELNNKINSELEVMAKIIYDYWFLQFEFPNEEGKPYKSSGGKMVWNEELKREIPEGWGITTIENIIVCHDSKRIPLSKKEREEMKGNIPYYGATGIVGYVNKPIFNGDYVLIAEDGSIMDEKGKPIIQRVEGEIWVNNHAHILEPKDNYSCKLLMLVLKDISVVQIKTGSIQMKINQQNLNRVKILDIPKEIKKKVNTYLNIIDRKILDNKKENQELISLRDFLLPLLMNGQVGFKEEN